MFEDFAINSGEKDSLFRRLLVYLTETHVSSSPKRVKRGFGVF